MLSVDQESQMKRQQSTKGAKASGFMISSVRVPDRRKIPCLVRYGGPGSVKP